MLKKIIIKVLITCFSGTLIAQYAEQIEPDFIKTIQFAGDTKQSQLPIIRLGEELFLSFHAQILKSFLFHKSENNACFFDYQFLKSNLFYFFRSYYFC